MAKSTAGGARSRQHTRYVARPRRRRIKWGALATYAGIAIAFVAVAAGLVLLSRGASHDGAGEARPISGTAPDFTLPAVNGDEISLASYRGDKNVLLFFNEGYGCGPCWQQSQEIQRHISELEAADTEYLVIMVDPPGLLSGEIKRWGLTMPVLTDVDRTVSEAYNTLGFGMHADKPNHTFVFIDKAGEIRWWEDYPSMRAPTDGVIKKVQALAGS
jgi:peroxiredoxin